MEEIHQTLISLSREVDQLSSIGTSLFGKEFEGCKELGNIRLKHFVVGVVGVVVVHLRTLIS